MSNQTLDKIATNTEMGALAAIDAIPADAGPSGDFKQLHTDLVNVYTALSFDVVGGIQAIEERLARVDGHFKPMVEDLGHMALLAGETYNLLESWFTMRSSQPVRGGKSGGAPKVSSSASAAPATSPIEVESEPKSTVEKVSEDTVDRLNHMISILKAAGASQNKFGEQTIEKLESMIETLEEGEKEKTAKELLWNEKSQAASKRIGNTLAQMFNWDKKEYKDEKKEKKKDDQLEFDFSQDIVKSVELNKVEVEAEKKTADNIEKLAKAKEQESKLQATVTQKQQRAGDQMELVGMEAAAEAVPPKISAAPKSTGAAPAARGALSGLNLGPMMTSLLGSIGGFVGTMMEVVEFTVTLSSIVSKLFVPISAAIAIVVGVVDFIRGFITGFSEVEGDFGEKLLGGLKQGFINVIDTFIAYPLDLLKDLVSWVADLFGFESFSKKLDAFNFGDWFAEKVGENVEELFGGIIQIFRDVVNIFKGKGSFTELFKDLVSQLITYVLYPLNGLTKMFGFNLTEKALEVLGLKAPADAPADNSTEAQKLDVEPALQAPELVGDGAQINAMKADTEDTGAQLADAAQISSMSGGGVSSSTNTNVSSVTVNSNNVPDRTAWQMTPAYGI